MYLRSMLIEEILFSLLELIIVGLGKGHKKEFHMCIQGKCTMHMINAKEDREGRKGP